MNITIGLLVHIQLIVEFLLASCMMSQDLMLWNMSICEIRVCSNV